MRKKHLIGMDGWIDAQKPVLEKDENNRKRERGANGAGWGGGERDRLAILVTSPDN